MREYDLKSKGSIRTVLAATKSLAGVSTYLVYSTLIFIIHPYA